MEREYTSQQLAWLIRRDGLEMTHLGHSSHIGSILSVADIVAVLYSTIHVYPKDPDNPNRDFVILSKGHAGAAFYACLAEKGFFPTSKLVTHYQNGSTLSGHVSHKGNPGVEFSTGSLGHGLGVGLGMAYALKKDNKPNKVYVILGDGECNEGSVWEAAMFAGFHHIDNLVAIVDRNRMASLDFTEKSLGIEPFADKWKAFNWRVLNIDGHNHQSLKRALSTANQPIGKPTVIIANTTKGKGISFMENKILWHYRYAHDGEEYDDAVKELNQQRPEGIKDPFAKE